MRSNKKSMRATSLRNTLIFLVLLTVAIAIGSFYFGSIWIHDYAVSVNQTVASATNSKTDDASLKKLQSDIAQQQSIITKTQALFTDQTSYQTQVVQDVSRYAAQLGMPTPSFSFQTAGTAAGATKTAPGNTVTVAVQSPIAYTTLLKFIMAIEQNIPKLQITGISIGRADAGQVTTDSLTIQVFTR